MQGCPKCGADLKTINTLENLSGRQILPEYDGAFSVVKPGRMTNLFPNPRPFLVNPAGYNNSTVGVEPTLFGSVDGAGGAGALGFTSLGKGCGGGWAHVVDPATGALGMFQRFPFSPQAELTAGQRYMWCVDVEMEQGGEFVLQVQTATGGVIQISEQYYGSGCCQRACICFTVPEGATRELEFVIGQTGGAVNRKPWYVSAWTLTETKTCNPVTFFDGYGFLDWDGEDYSQISDPRFNPYYSWSGPPFGSASNKGWATRSAGELVNLRDCGLRITGWTGLGMAQPRNIRQPYAKIDGSYSKGRTYDEHDFSLKARIYPLCDSCNRQNGLDCARAKLLELFGDCSSEFREDLVIRYQPQDECGRPCGCPVEIVCTYEGGLEGIVDNCIGEDVELRFNMRRPCVRSAARKAIIGIVGVTPATMQQNPDGTWRAEYTPAFCNNGTKPAPFAWVFSGSSDNTGSFCVESIRHEETGNIIAFEQPVDVEGNQQLAVNTDPENSFAQHFDFNTGAVTSPLLAACSNLNGMEMVCGINHFTVVVDKIVDPNYDPFNQGPFAQHVPPLSRFVFREQFNGISEACCYNSDDCPCGADDVIEPWDFAGPV